MNDARGYPLQIGDIVAYPGRKGSSCWLTPAMVVDLRPGSATQVPGIKVHPVDPTTDQKLSPERPRWVTHLENVVRLHRPHPSERV